MDNADYSKADAVELVNGSSLASADRNPEGIVSAIPFWIKLQSQGFALTPRGLGIPTVFWACFSVWDDALAHLEVSFPKMW